MDQPKEGFWRRSRNAVQRLLGQPDSPTPPSDRHEAVSGMKSAALTDTGMVRLSNQDTVLEEAPLFGVADGMGGHQGGEIASAEAAASLLDGLRGVEPEMARLHKAVDQANLAVFEHAQRDEHLNGMGTTLTVLWLAREEALIAHVGDSRCYLLRDGLLRQVTEDHSLVGEMVRKGMLTPEEAAEHPMRNVITRALGTADQLQAEVLAIPRHTGDRWLICSDGLHGMVDEAALLKTLTEEAEPLPAAQRLLQQALDAGGRDNVSVVVVDDGEVSAHD